LDWHGALIAGADTDAASRLRDAYSEEFGVGQCSVAGSQKKVFARAAAFMNGTISHIAEFDDIFRDGAYHPACPTISAKISKLPFSSSASGTNRCIDLFKITTGINAKTAY
jgi:2-methylcitrate dehydratase PrpD